MTDITTSARASSSPIRTVLHLVVLAALAAVPFLGLPTFIVQVASSAGIAVIFALGLNLLFGYCGQISFGHAGFYAVGAYAVALTAPAVGYIPSLFLALVVGMAVAMLIGFPLLRLRGHYLALGTLAFGITVEFLVLQGGDVTGGPWGVSIDRPTVFDARLTAGHFYMLILVCTVVAFYFSRNLVNSRIGRAMQTIREDEALAMSVGVNTVLFKVAVFGISGAFAAIAGGLYAGLNLYITPELFDIRLSIGVVVMIVLGGAGTPMGPVIGAVLLTFLPELLHGFQEYAAMIYGLILLLVLRFMPGGLVGLARRFIPAAAPEGRGRASDAAS